MALPLPLINSLINGASHASRGDDDFDGHKTYQQGDASSRVDWKASSRGIGMFTKHYSGDGAGDLWLDFSITHGEFEARIAQLAQWVVDAQIARRRYGLTLPNLSVAPNNSEAHYHACMRALSLI